MGAFRTLGVGWNSLVNSSFTGNVGPALRIDATQPTSIVNSVFWGNTGGDVSGLSTPFAHYCIFSSALSLPGDGSFSADPKWANPSDPNGPDEQWGTADDGLRLQATSPALNSGKASLLPPDIADLDRDGNISEPVSLDIAEQTRAIDGIPEIGAYEFAPAGMNLAYWRTLNFNGAVRSDPAKEATVWGNFADPDGDSVPNCGEYKLLLNPGLNDSPLNGVALVDRFGGKWMRFEYTLALDRPDVSAFTEITTSLPSGPWLRSGFFSGLLSSTPTTQTWEILVPATPPHGFARMAFTIP